MRGVLFGLCVVLMSGTVLAQNEVHVTGEITVRERKGLDPTIPLRAYDSQVHVQTLAETEEKFLRLRLLRQQADMQQLQLEAQRRALQPAPTPAPTAVRPVVTPPPVVSSVNPGLADTGKDLADVCRSDELLCKSFLVGVVDTLDALVAANILSVDWWRADKTDINVHHVVAMYMQAHPDSAEMPAAAVVMIALHDVLAPVSR